MSSRKRPHTSRRSEGKRKPDSSMREEARHPQMSSGAEMQGFEEAIHYEETNLPSTQAHYSDITSYGQIGAEWPHASSLDLTTATEHIGATSAFDPSTYSLDMDLLPVGAHGMETRSHNRGDPISWDTETGISLQPGYSQGQSSQQRKQQQRLERLRARPHRTFRQRRIAYSVDSTVDLLLLKLRSDHPNMSWVTVAEKIEAETGELHQIPALQMRYKRVRERLQTREQRDAEALKTSIQYWENQKWNIVAQNMAKFGAEGNWTAKDCEYRWLKIQMQRLREE